MSATPTAESFVPPTYNRCMVGLHFTDAKPALAWYIDVLGAKERRRFESADKKHIMHAELQLGDTVLMLSDMVDLSAKEHGPGNATLYTYVPDVDGLYATALKHGAAGKSTPRDMFYGDRMAIFKDPFGNDWVIARSVHVKSDEEVRSAIEEGRAKAEAASDAQSGAACCNNMQVIDNCAVEQKASFDVSTANADLARWKKMNQIHHVKLTDRKPKQIVSEDEWLVRHQQHLLTEKALTHHRDYATSMRQQLPWTEIRSDYVFEDFHGKKFTLQELFTNPKLDDLIIYHQMLPDKAEDNRSCPGCAMMIDTIAANLFSLQQKTNIAIVAKGSPKLMETFAKSRGWIDLPMYSTHLSTFNEDLAYSTTPAQFEEFKRLIAENNGDNNLALQKLRQINPTHPNVRFNFNNGSPWNILNFPGFTVLHLDRNAKKVYKTNVVQGRGSECASAAVQIMDLLPYGRESFRPTHKP